MAGADGTLWEPGAGEGWITEALKSRQRWDKKQGISWTHCWFAYRGEKAGLTGKVSGWRAEGGDAHESK